MSLLSAAALVDDLYRQAVTDPAVIDDAHLADWMEQAAEMVGYDRALLRPVRAAVRNARKIATRLGTTPTRLPDWTNGVDEVLGSKGWEPQLELVRAALEVAPSPDAFAAVKERHRAVHFNEWMEGVGFEEWSATR